MAKASKVKVAPAPEPADPAGMPESFKAFTTLKVPKGWAYVELTLDKDLVVTECEVSQPDVRAIIQERFKIAVGKHWLKQNG